MPVTSELELLYQALASPIGIVVRTSNFSLCQQRFYRARREAGDPALDCLQLRRSPFAPEGEIWIVKGGAHSAQKGQDDPPAATTVAAPVSEPGTQDS